MLSDKAKLYWCKENENMLNMWSGTLFTDMTVFLSKNTFPLMSQVSSANLHKSNVKYFNGLGQCCCLAHFNGTPSWAQQGSWYTVEVIWDIILQQICTSAKTTESYCTCCFFCLPCSLWDIQHSDQFPKLFIPALFYYTVKCCTVNYTVKYPIT